MKRRSSLRGTRAPMPSCAMCAPPLEHLLITLSECPFTFPRRGEVKSGATMSLIQPSNSALGACAALGHGRHRLDDVVIAGTAAQIAVEIGPYGGLVRMRDAPDEIDCRHDHAGRTEPALQRMMLVKRRLHGMKLTPLGQPLD